MGFIRAQTDTKKIKIIINGGLGDCILATPFIRYFYESGKYSEIICVIPVQAKELFDNNKYITKLIPCTSSDLFLWAMPEVDCDVFSPYIYIPEADKIIDFTKIKIKYHQFMNLYDKYMIDQMIEFFNFDIKDKSLDVFTTKEDETWADKYIEKFNENKVVLLSICSALPEKDYPQKLAQTFVDFVNDNNLNIKIINLSANKIELKNTIALDPLPTLRQSTALFKRAHVVISVDSLAGHLAAAVKTKAIVLFGPSNNKAYGHEANINIRTSSCKHCADTPRRRECTYSKCMDDIDPKIIYNELIKIIN